MKQEFNGIVVGAGSAGCVLINRLSADSNTGGLLTEAGGRDNHLAMRIPLAMMSLVLTQTVTRAFETEPEPLARIDACPFRADRYLAAHRQSTPCSTPGADH